MLSRELKSKISKGGARKKSVVHCLKLTEYAIQRSLLLSAFAINQNNLMIFVKAYLSRTTGQWYNAVRSPPTASSNSTR